MIPSDDVLLLAAALFVTGCMGVVVRRNVLVVLMGLELMLNGANLTLVAFSRMHGDLHGQILALFVIVVAAAEAAVGLAIAIGVYRCARSVETSDAGEMRG